LGSNPAEGTAYSHFFLSRWSSIRSSFSPLESGCYRPKLVHYWSTYAPPSPSAHPCIPLFFLAQLTPREAATYGADPSRSDKRKKQAGSWRHKLFYAVPVVPCSVICHLIALCAVRYLHCAASGTCICARHCGICICTAASASALRHLHLHGPYLPIEAGPGVLPQIRTRHH
jgi:hypothetical protein